MTTQTPEEQDRWRRTYGGDLAEITREIVATHIPDGAHRTGEKLYKIRRFYRDDEQRNGEVIERGLTLAEAQAHCQDESTHAYNEAGEVVWFDGYDEEGEGE